MSTAAQLYMTLHRLATAAEAPDTATRTQGISRNELLTLLGISTRANGSLSEAQERAFERAKQTLRDAGARITLRSSASSTPSCAAGKAPNCRMTPTASCVRLR